MKNYNLKDETQSKKFEGFSAVKSKTEFGPEVVIITIEPGKEVPEHKTPVDVLFFVLEGAITVQIGDEFIEHSEGSLIESPKEITHSLKNNSSKPSKMLVTKLFSK